MKLSARNIWAGQVASIQTGEVNSVVKVALKSRGALVFVMINSSVERLGLQTGSEVLAFVKESLVIVDRNLPKNYLSACHIMTATGSHNVEGVANDEVTNQLADVSSVSSCTAMAGAPVEFAWWCREVRKERKACCTPG